MKNSLNKIALAMLTVSLLGLGTATATAQKRGGSQRVGKKPATVRQQLKAPSRHNANFRRANQPLIRAKVQKKAKVRNYRRSKHRHDRRDRRKVNIIGSVLNTFGQALHQHRHDQCCDSHVVGGYYRTEVYRDYVPGHYEDRVVRRSHKRSHRRGRGHVKVKRVWVKGYYVSRTRQVWVPRERVYRCGF